MVINNNFLNDSLINIEENNLTRKGVKVNGQSYDPTLDRAMADNPDLAPIDVDNISSRLDSMRNELSGNNTFNRNGNDIRSGSNDGDTIYDYDNSNIASFDGNDRIISAVVSDAIIDSGDGDDNVSSTSGNDVIDAGAGDDLISGGSGNDSILAGSGDDRVYGGNGNDVIYGEAGDDHIIAGNGDDYIHGGPGNDLIDAGNGNDFIVAGTGQNTVMGGLGEDTVVFEGSTDDFIIDYDSGNNIRITDADNPENTTTVMSVENFLFLTDDGEELFTIAELHEAIALGFATDSDDVLEGTDGDDEINGLDGDDTINGNGGNDTLIGGEGNDILNGGAGNDNLNGGEGNDTINGGDGDDIIDGGAGDDIIDGGDGDDTIDGGAGDDIIDGGAGDDTIDGGSGNDTIDGGFGDDVIDGSEGNDNIEGGAGDDIITDGYGDNTIDGGEGNDTLALNKGFSSYSITDEGNNTFTFTDNDNGDVNTVTNVETFAFGDQTVTSSELQDMIAPREVIVVGGWDAHSLGDIMGVSGGQFGDNHNGYNYNQINYDSTNDELYQNVLAMMSDEDKEMSATTPVIVDIHSGEVLGTIDRNELSGNTNAWGDVADDTVAGQTIEVEGQDYEVVDSSFRWSSPVILDIDGDGIELTSVENGVNFDLNADQQLDRTAWTQSSQGFDDAFLALDRNGNGQIDDGSELFGDQNDADNGYEELAKLDTNQDGQITSEDEAFSELKVWADMDGDGKVGKGEMKGLEEVGITSISTNYSGNVGEKFDKNGNDISLTSSFTMDVDGESVTRDTVDAFFVNRDITNDEEQRIFIEDEIASLESELLTLESTPNYDEDKANSLRSDIDAKKSQLAFL